MFLLEFFREKKEPKAKRENGYFGVFFLEGNAFKSEKNGCFRKLLIVNDFRFLYNFGSSKAPLSTIESDAFVERKRRFRWWKVMLWKRQSATFEGIKHK